MLLQRPPTGPNSPMPHKQPNPDPSTQTLFTLFRKSKAIIQSLIQQQASNSFTCPHRNQTSPSSSSDDLTRGAGLYESYAWMYLRSCLCVCTYVFLSSSCSIIHPFSTVGNRHRFMACDCAMSGFIRSTEGKLTRATKGHFCLNLISMNSWERGFVGRFSLRDHGSPLVFPIFIWLIQSRPDPRPAPD